MTLIVTRLLVVTDVRLFREGLAQVLDAEEGLRITGTAASRLEALGQLEAAVADIVLVDMAMAESVDTVCAIVARAPDVKVIALAVPEVDQHIIACAEAGAVAYVPRDGSLRDLIDAIHGVVRGEAQSSPRIVGSLLRRLAALAAERSGGRAGVPLTARELQIVRLLGEGATNKDLANALNIGLATVKNHVHHILAKLHVKRRGEAAASYRRSSGQRLTPPT
jgi:DNA-binding NarL/FixJ family response regulator